MNNSALKIPSVSYRYKAMICTGGIGSGALFLLSGNHTLGREESRGGKYLDARDYCKMHIIAHNVKVLAGELFPVFPVGMIGGDEVGRSLYHEMKDAGLEMEYVRIAENERTLFGFCFLYPDGTGGNLTTEESASNKVDPGFIRTAEPEFRKFEGQFIALAVPEVPLEARYELLKMAQYHKGFSVATFTSGEMPVVESSGMIRLVNLLAINLDEAAALAGVGVEVKQPEEIIERVVKKMVSVNPGILLSITAGKKGSWTWDGRNLSYAEIFPVEVKSSAGAGDAHISAIIVGLTAGLSLAQAQVLGNLAAAFSATSPHTIHPEMKRVKLLELANLYSDRIDRHVLDLIVD